MRCVKGVVLAEHHVAVTPLRASRFLHAEDQIRGAGEPCRRVIPDSPRRCY